MKYKILLLTSGTGSRLGELTKNTNKALVPVAGRPTIEYILESCPKEVSIVVTLGYLANDVKEYLEKNHPDRIFEFVLVDKYEGPGSSVGYSTLRAKDNLQCPFIFRACDGIFTEPIPEPSKNWIGGYVEDWKTSALDLGQYDTCTIKDGKVVRFNERGTPDFDSIYLGLDGIFDYELYWQIMDDLHKSDPLSSKLHPIQVLNSMLAKGKEFQSVAYSVWLDTGNIPALKKTEEYLKDK